MCRRFLAFLVSAELAMACSGSSSARGPVVTAPEGGSDSPDGGAPVSGEAVPDAGPVAPADLDWPQFRHDVRGSSAAGATLTRAQGASLHEVWSFELGPYAFAEPIRAADSVYATTAVLGRVFALDAATGQVRWTRDLGTTITSVCGGDDKPGIWGSPALAGGTLYVSAPDGAVHAMDQRRAPIASPPASRTRRHTPS
jgi:hypothetical protein